MCARDGVAHNVAAKPRATRQSCGLASSSPNINRGTYVPATRVCARDGVAHDVAAKLRAAKLWPTRPCGKAAALRHVAAKPRAAKPRII